VRHGAAVGFAHPVPLRLDIAAAETVNCGRLSCTFVARAIRRATARVSVPASADPGPGSGRLSCVRWCGTGCWTATDYRSVAHRPL